MPLPQVQGLEAMIARGPQSRDVTPTHLLTRVEERPPSETGQRAPCTYKEWMTKTALDWKHPRSTRMKALDKALKAHEESGYSVATARKLRTAINDWIRWKGTETWKTSERNKDHIIELLRVWAFAPGLPTAMSREEIAALNFVEEHRRRAMHTLFSGKKVSLKISSAMKMAGSAASDAKKAATELKRTLGVLNGAIASAPHHTPNFGTGLQATRQAGAVAKDFIQDDLLDMKNLNMDTIRHMKELIPLDTITADFIPFVNIVTGAIGVIAAWGKVAKAAYDMSKAEDSRYVIEKGDPQRAFEGLFEMLSRDRTTKALQATQSTVKFAAQTAGTFADLGAASGPALAAANAAATFAHKMFLFGRELKEVNAANEILADPSTLDFRLFEKYPLAGCYMLRCTNTSDVLAMSTVMWGNSGWMDDVDHMRKNYLEPLQKHCDRFIKESLFQFGPDMPMIPIPS